jgi:hypothetical protein
MSRQTCKGNADWWPVSALQRPGCTDRILDKTSAGERVDRRVVEVGGRRAESARAAGREAEGRLSKTEGVLVAVPDLLRTGRRGDGGQKQGERPALIVRQCCKLRR